MKNYEAVRVHLNVEICFRNLELGVVDSMVNDPPRAYIISFSRHMAPTDTGNLNWGLGFRRIIELFSLSPLDI